MAYSDAKKNRLVIHAGPHKSASSSTQEFFVRHASDPPNKPKRHHPSLSEWTWPTRKGKAFAPLVIQANSTELEQGIHDSILEAYRNSTTHNIILGSEEFDRFGTTLWSHRDGISAIQKLIDLLNPDSVDIVVNYRRPRSEQWISIWKQLIKRKRVNLKYAEYLCRADYQEMLWEYLDCVSNPIGLVNALLEKFAKRARIHILDMKGIEDADRDVPHVLACSILGADCTEDDSVRGIGLSPRLNQKSGDPELTDQQLQDMDWLFLQRDCTYSIPVQHHESLKIHYEKDMFTQCPDTVNLQFRNTTFLLELLQSQVGCGSIPFDEKLKELGLESKPVVRQPTRAAGFDAANHSNTASKTDNNSLELIIRNDLEMQMYIIVVAFLLFFGYYFIRRTTIKRRRTKSDALVLQNGLPQ